MEEIVELCSEDEWREAFSILRSLRSELTEEELLARRRLFLADKFVQEL